MYAKLVANIKYFTECHESLISDIVMLMHPFSVLKNEFVYVQHEIAAHVFFLLKGKIYVSRTLPSVKGDVKLATHSIGEHFGEVRLVAFAYWRPSGVLVSFSYSPARMCADGGVRPRTWQRRAHVLSDCAVVLRAHVPLTGGDPEAQCVSVSVDWSYDVPSAWAPRTDGLEHVLRS